MNESMITYEDVKELKKEFDERYVLTCECGEIQKKINGRFANDDKRIELLIHQQNINNWLTGVIASGIIALVIKVFFGN